MKILKIFGIVVAIHAFAFVLIFANPGCSSPTKAAPGATAPASAPTRPPTVSVPASGGEVPMITSTPAAAPMGGFDPNAPAVASTVRYTPTRPGTPAATAVQVQPVADVVPATTYAVGTGDSLWTVAKKNHLTVAELSAANNIPVSAKLKLGQKLIIPSKSGATTAAPAASGGAPTYKVKTGDKLSVIAKRAGTTTAVLKELNGLKSDTVVVGRELKLPAGTAMADAAPASDMGVPAAKPSSDSFTHTVKAGESLSGIAQKYQVKYNEIAVANSITDPMKIRPGMVLIIPGWKAPKSTKTAEEPPGAVKVLTPDRDAGAAPKSTAPGDIPVIKIEEPSAGSSRKP